MNVEIRGRVRGGMPQRPFHKIGLAKLRQLAPSTSDGQRFSIVDGQVALTPLHQSEGEERSPRVAEDLYVPCSHDVRYASCSGVRVSMSTPIA